MVLTARRGVGARTQASAAPRLVSAPAPPAGGDSSVTDVSKQNTFLLSSSN